MSRILRLTILGVLFILTAYAMTSTAAAQQMRAVHTFVCKGQQGLGACPEGGSPTSIIQASDGNFYGTAFVTTQANHGLPGGLVFSLTPSGAFHTVYNFSNKNPASGSNPIQIIEGPDDKLYGITGAGGDGNAGVLFRVNKDGSEFQVVHVYSYCAEGCDPQSLVAGNDGNVYGVNLYSGTTNCYQCGSIFQVNTASGTYKPIVVTGYHPSNMAVGSDGTFYGLFESENTVAPVLFHYDESTGALERYGLDFVGLPAFAVFGSNGNIYGLDENFDKGVSLFEIQPNGTNLQVFAVLPNFDITGEVSSPLTLASNNNLWTAQYDEQAGYGQLLEISSSNGTVLQTLTPFSQTAAVGATPVALVSAQNGALWGISQGYGNAPEGSYAEGVVFTFKP